MSNDQLRRCAGPCGRMTRNSKMPKHKFPDAVIRGSVDMCTTCRNRILREAGDPDELAGREKRAQADRERKEAGVRAAFRAREDYLAGRARRQAQAQRRASA